MRFKLMGKIILMDTMAIRFSIRDLHRLRKLYGNGRWRKRKGFGRVRLETGVECRVELHWYEANGIGKREIKIKRILDR